MPLLIPKDKTYFIVLGTNKPMSFNDIKDARTRFDRSIREKWKVGIVSVIQYPNEECDNLHIEMMVTFYDYIPPRLIEQLQSK